jgi:hypothetical protein
VGESLRPKPASRSNKRGSSATVVALINGFVEARAQIASRRWPTDVFHVGSNAFVTSDLNQLGGRLGYETKCQVGAGTP